MRRTLLIGLTLVFLAGCAGAPRAKYPIDRAQGRYTVVALTFRDDVAKDGSVHRYAVAMANNWAEHLRGQGHQEVYVADLGTEAMVTMGSYPSRESARRAVRDIAKVLQQNVGAQVRVRGGTKTTGGRQVLGLRPYPEELKHIKDLSKRRRR